jgi:hypothetical protein
MKRFGSCLFWAMAFYGGFIPLPLVTMFAALIVAHVGYWGSAWFLFSLAGSTLIAHRVACYRGMVI